MNSTHSLPVPARSPGVALGSRPLVEISVCKHACIHVVAQPHTLPRWLTVSLSSGMNALQLQNLATLAAAAAAAQSSASPSTASALTSSTGSLGALASPGNRRPPSLHRHRHHSHCCSISTTAVTLFPPPSIESPSSTSSCSVIASESPRHEPRVCTPLHFVLVYPRLGTLSGFVAAAASSVALGALRKGQGYFWERSLL